MAGAQRAVNRAGRESFTADRVGKTVIASEVEDDRPVDAVAGWRPVAAIDVTDKVLVGIAPAHDIVIGAHHGQPDVRVLLGEQLWLPDRDSVIGESLL